MGKTMEKKNVIWGEQHSVSLASFSSAHMAAIVDLIQHNIGPTEKINHAAAQSAVLKAKGNPKMKNGYVKVGLIGTDLVLRCKEKKFLGDIEVDAILVAKYPAKVQAWKIEQTRIEMDKLEQAAAAREKLRRENEQARRVEEERKAKAQRLHQVMNTPDEEGDTLRTKILRTAEKAQKLGVGDYAKQKLKDQGLQPMHEDYHGEVLDHQKNRYGRYLPQLRKVWEDKGPKKGSFSKWLDDVEANKTSVAGVSEALALTHREVGKIVQPGGIVGGRVTNLDDETRKAYVARVSKGTLSGPTVKGTDVIFVIGPDSKVYVGTKARAQPGKAGAFNHSSFFSGGPVKSAGSLKLSGGRIVEVSDVSGHYAPTKAMVVQAVRKFAGGDQVWLGEVQVRLGTAQPITGAALLGEAHEQDSNEIWGKYSTGPLNTVSAGKVLMAAADGNWLVRADRDGKLKISYRQGDKVDSDWVTTIASKGLDRKKLLLPNQVTALLSSLPKTTATPRPVGEREQPESESQQKTRTPRQRATTTAWTVTPEIIEAAHNSPGWHGVMNSERAGELLGSKPNAWLLRENKDHFITLSRLDAQKKVYEHTLVTNESSYRFMLQFIGSHPNDVVRP